MYSNVQTSIYDVIIVGSGPAGLGAAYRLIHSKPNIKVCLIEAGRFFNHRPCPVDSGYSCLGCGGTCNVVSGFGGCMHYGDGVKLSLMPSGRRLIELLGDKAAYELSDLSFKILTSYLSEGLTLTGQNISAEIHKYFIDYGLSIRKYPVAVVSETELKRIIRGLYDDLAKHVTLQLETVVTNVRPDSGSYMVETKSKGKKVQVVCFRSRNVIFATGRRGITETQKILRKLEIPMLTPKPSIGVRFEMDASYLKMTGLIHPDMKISQHNLKEGKDKVKTFCFCGGVNGGRVKFTNYQQAFGESIITLDGHETLERKPGKRNLAANFGLMCQIAENFKNTDEWLEQNVIVPYRRISSCHPVAQRLRNFKERRAEELSWDLLNETLPFDPSVSNLKTGSLHELFSQREHASLVEGFVQLMEPILQISKSDKKVCDLLDEILVIGLELEFLWNRVCIDSFGETERKGIFVVGDAAGIAQGVIQSMMMGLRASDKIATERI
jgi:uncharacterized FAD-dependent dehydrogenase